MKFSRRVLHVCWDAILDVLSTVLNGKGAAGISNSLSLLIAGKEESRRAKEIICSCLDGLQKAARLSCVLGKSLKQFSVFCGFVCFEFLHQLSLYLPSQACRIGVALFLHKWPTPRACWKICTKKNGKVPNRLWVAGRRKWRVCTLRMC